MAGGRVKGITIDIDGNTTGLTKALKDVNGQTAKTSTELKDVNKLLKLDPGNTELLAQKQKLLSNAVESTSTKLKALKSAQAQVEAQFKSGDIGEEQYRSFQREIVATEGQLERFKQGAKGVDDALNGIDSAAAKSESGFKDLNKSAKDTDASLNFTKGAAAGEMLMGLSEKSRGLGTDLLSTSMDFQDAQAKIQAALGLTDEESKKAMDSVHGVFDSGLVDSAGEATEAVITTKNSFQDLDGVELTNMTNSLLKIAQVTGNDIEDTANAASQAMKGFGIDGKEASDIVAKGLQLGLDKNHDFLDTMNEYSPLFKDAGLNAQQMLNVMNEGMKSGAFNTDKAADAVKEFNTKLTGGDLDEKMNQFGDATQKVFQEFKNGQATATDVMASVGKDLKDMPASEASAAVQTIGTQFEDMGQDASASLLMATDGIVKTDGAAQKMNKTSPGQDWKSGINSLKDSFSSLLDALGPVIKALADVMKNIAGMGQPAKAIIGIFGGIVVALGAIAPVAVGLRSTIGVFKDMGSAVGALKNSTKLASAANTIFSGSQKALTGVLNTSKSAISGVGSGMKLMVTSIKDAQIGTKIASAATKVWTGVQMAFNAVMAMNPLTLWLVAIAAVIAIIAIVITKMNAWGDIADWLVGVWNAIPEFFSGIWEGIKNIFQTTVEWIGSFLQSGFGQAILFIINPFAGLVNFFIQNWDQIKQIFTNVVTAIGQFLSDSWNKIKQVTSDLWNGTKDVISDVVNGIKTTVSNVFNTVKNFVSDVWNGIKTITNNVWNGIKKIISTAVNNLKTTISNVFNTIKSVISNIWNGIKSVTSNVWNGIKDVVGKVVNGVKNTVSNGFNAVKNAVSNIFNSVKNTVKSIWDGIWNTISGIVDKIKGAFNFNLKFPDIKIPHIPMPHFNISGSFDPLKGKIPSVGINWYAKGGIFNKPTLFAANGGFNGLGEAGPEAALPLNKKTLGGIGEGIAQAMGSNGLGDKFEININVMADVTPKTINQISEQVQVGMTRALNAKNRVIGG